MGYKIKSTVLYKYIKKEYLVSFFKNGSLKIGTLHEYRNEEEFGSIIGDDKEGIHITELNSPAGREIDLSGNSPEAEYFKRHVLRPDQQNLKVKIVMAPGANMIAHTKSPNYYIYCVTSEYDKDVMEEFDCDSCIEIFNPEKYFKVISKVIRHKCSFEGYFDIRYGSKTTDHLNPHKIHPALMKEEKYYNQSEIRAIWKPKKEVINSLFIKVPKAMKYCREYKP